MPALILLGSCAAPKDEVLDVANGDELRARVNSALREAGSFEFHGEMSFAGLGPKAQQAKIEGFYNLEGPVVRLVTTPIDADPSDMATETGGEQRLIGNTLYTFPTPFTRGRAFEVNQYWLEQPTGSEAGTTQSGVDLARQIRQLLQVPEGFSIENEKSTDNATAYTGVVDPEEVPARLAALDLRTRFSVIVDDAGLPLEILWLIDQQGPDGRLTSRMEFSLDAFGTTQIVERPPAKRTVTLEEYESYLDEYSVPVSP